MELLPIASMNHHTTVHVNMSSSLNFVPKTEMRGSAPPYLPFTAPLPCESNRLQIPPEMIAILCSSLPCK